MPKKGALDFSPPPCCEKSPCAMIGRNCCNCFTFVRKYRKQLMWSLFVVQVIAIVPASIAIVGQARDRQLMIGGWAALNVDGKNGGDSFDVYVGFNGFYVKGGEEGNDFLTWNDIKDRVDPSEKDDVNSCKHAARDELSTAVLGLVTILPSLGTIVTRAFAEYDTGCNKFAGMMSGFMGGLSTLSSMSTFIDQCYDELPTTFVNGNGTTIGKGNKRHGPGLISEGFVVAICFICGFAHVLLPIPKDVHASDDDDEKHRVDNKLAPAPQVADQDQEGFLGDDDNL